VKIRAPTAAELAGLSPMLDAAFEGYAEALHYAKGPTNFFSRWCWSHQRSAAAEVDGRVVGVAVASPRGGRWGGEPLDIVHVGPVAVTPAHRGGVGTALMNHVIDQARSDGADLLTLTTQRPYGAWRLYRRLGFAVVEAFRPPWRSRIRQRPPGWAGGLEVRPSRWRERVAPRSYRDGAIVERPTPRMPPDNPLKVRWFASGDAGVITLRWPVLSRTRGVSRSIHSVQVIDARGGGRDLERVLSDAEAAAAEDGATALFRLPSAQMPDGDWQLTGSALTYRMCRPLTPAGRRAVESAACYDDRAPSP